MARHKAPKTSTADLRAMRELKGQQVSGPVLEATRRAQTIRDGLDRLPTLTEAIIEAFRQDDWRTLGYASFTAYTQAEFGEERLNLTPAQRSVLVIAFVEAGMSKRAVAAAVGVDESTVRQDLKVAGNPAGPMAPRREKPQVSDSAPNADHHEQVGVPDPRPTDQEEPGHPPAGSSTQLPADPDHPEVSNSGDEETTGDRYNGSAGQEPTAALKGSAAVGEPNADLGSPETGDGGVPPVAAVSGQDHPGREPGEAPTGSEVPSGASAQPSDVGEASGDETAEAGLLPPRPGFRCRPADRVAGRTEKAHRRVVGRA